MKHLNYLLLGAVGLMLASCSQEDMSVISSNEDGTANVSLTLSVPQLKTRSYSDGKTAINLQYAVYKKDNSTGELTWLDMNGKGTMTNLQEHVNFKLVTNHTYGFVFWADSGETPYTITFGSDGATMTINYDEEEGTPTANNEKLDAFYAYHEVTVTGNANETVYLYRPFAQINVGTSDLTDSKKAGYVPTQSHVTVSGIYDTLDLVSGEVSNSDDETNKSHDFSFAALPSGETFPVENHDYLAMVYALVPSDQKTVEVEFCIKDDNEEHAAEHTVGSVPVQRNYRTNIFGQLITSNVDVNVIIEPAYEKPDYFVNHDGVEYDATSNTYTITNAHGLEWLSQRVNCNDGKDNVSTETPAGVYGSPKCSFYGQKVVLANDIDMTVCGTRAGEILSFQPIGYSNQSNGQSTHAFAGEFDGQGHTITGLTVYTERNSNAGLFGYTERATIKDVTLKDVNINGHYKVGALVAYARNTNIEGCKVSGGSVTTTPWEIKPGVYDDGNNAGGLIGYYDNQPFTGVVKNNTVENLEVTAFRRIGGLAGRIGARDDSTPRSCGIEISGNTVSNVTLTVDQTEIRYDDYPSMKDKAQIGELYGLIEVQGYANPSNYQEDGFTNVTKKEIYPAVASDDQSLSSVLSGINDGDVIVIDGENIELPINMPAKEFTIKGLGPDVSSINIQLNYNQASGAKITFQDITITSAPSVTNHSSIKMTDADEVHLKNVVVNGEFHTSAGNQNATFENCQFNYDIPSNNNYLLWLESAGDVLVKDCKFNNINAKAILICENSSNKAVMGNVTVENCSFTAEQSSDKAAVEAHSENYTSAGILTINNCTYDASKYQGGLWREINNKNGDQNYGQSTDFFTVIVDGKEQ